MNDDRSAPLRWWGRLGLLAALTTTARTVLAEEAQPPAPCSVDRARAVERGVRAFGARYLSEQRAAFDAGECARASVVCLDRFGDHPYDTLPARVTAGTPLVVRALVPVSDEGRLTISASVRAQAAHGGGAPPADEPAAEPQPPSAASCVASEEDAARIAGAAAPLIALAATDGMHSFDARPRAPSDTVNAWESWLLAHPASAPLFSVVTASLEVPDAELAVDVDATRTNCASGACSASATRHYDVAIDNGRYYLELSVLVPVVYKGTRRAVLAPGTSELRVGVDEAWYVTGALAVDVFPFGRARGHVSSFRSCRDGSCYANWLGLQLGTSFERPAEDWFVGVVLEPISGVALGIGAALRKGEFLARGVAEGMLLPSRAAFETRTEYMARPYLGLTITTDVFHTIDRGALSLRRMR